MIKERVRMKKIFAVVLCLMMLLPAFAMAEAVPAENWVTVDLGDFTMNMIDTDILQRGEKAEGQLIFIAYPGYDENDASHDNMNCAWTSDTMEGIEEATQDDVNAFAQQVLDSIKDQTVAQGLAVENEQLLNAVYEDGALIVYYYMECDYSAMGIDLQTQLYQMQIYLITDDGTYIFSLTSSTPDGVLNQLNNYFATIQFKN